MTATTPIQNGRRYRRLTYGLLLIGMVSLVVGMSIDQSLAGLVVYAIAVVVAFAVIVAVRFSDSVAMQDERENELERRASHLTFQLFGYLGLFAFIALFLLDATGYYSLGTRSEALLYAYAAIMLTWGAIFVTLRYRS